jgi:pimeloyl-ACP methyl ester carboxylesterase
MAVGRMPDRAPLGAAAATTAAAAAAGDAQPSKPAHIALALTFASPLFSLRSLAMLLGGLYAGALLALLTSRRAQSLLVYLHWLRPPAALAPLDTLAPYRLDAVGRVVSAGHLRGWHLLPPGPPFAPPHTTDDDDGTTLDRTARDCFFDEEMRRHPNTRVVIFFHGNSGTRAFPFKRVDMLRLLGTSLHAHVVTFDYTGFGDSPGRPSEEQFYKDAYSVYRWVADRTSSSAQIVLYGQSLGTFAASHLASTVCPHVGQEDENTPWLHRNEEENSSSSSKACHKLRAVVLDAPPACLYDASMSHASVALFRTMPFMRRITRAVLHESHDSLKHCSMIAAPLLILHGEKDSLIPIDQGRRIHAAAVQAGNKHAFFVPFPNAGHNDVNAASNYPRVLSEFVSKFAASPPCRACCTNTDLVQL